MSYEAPRLTVHGPIQSLTLQQGGPPNGNDPCRFNNPRDTFKQTGAADLIQGQAALQTCTPTSA